MSIVSLFFPERRTAETANAKDDMDAKNARQMLTAAKSGDLAGVKQMLALDVNVNSRCSSGDESTALTCAVYNNHLPVVQYLVETAKADIDTRDAFGATPLMYAARNGYGSMMRYLVEEAKASVEARDTHGATALIRSARFGRLDIVQYLVEQAKADALAVDDYGRTAAEMAAEVSGGEGGAVVEYLKRQAGGR